MRIEPPVPWLPALREPRIALTWSMADWESTVRQARRLRLLARLSDSLDRHGLLADVPEAPKRLLRAEQRLSNYRITVTSWAARCVGEELATLGVPLVLLKGGAYLAQGLAIAGGRLPSDLDIMVPKRSLDVVHEALLRAAWTDAELDAHDQRYYGEWSHEIAPMQHPVHPIELDVHHNILPPVGRHRVDADLLFERIVPSPWQGWSMLSPHDQVLHSAAHLFYDAEPLERLRDLVDLDGLMRHHADSTPDFWPRLAERAIQLNLCTPLALAFHFCGRWLATPVPEHERRLVTRQGLGPARRALLLPALGAVLRPAALDRKRPLGQRLAASALLVRYQLGRLPPRLLVSHVWHKVASRTARP